ncbi:other/IKS protein kinase [Mycena olivaceomarginata]|nr:other/IKS protein kinase [Mycena olivaceomarginata]
MPEDSQPSSPHGALVALVPSPEHEWQPIFHASNQVVLYNPTSHALFHPAFIQTLPLRAHGVRVRIATRPYLRTFDLTPELEDDPVDAASSFRASNYFHLLAIANETTSRPSTPPTPTESRSRRNTFPAEAMAEGYFKAFFQEDVGWEWVPTGVFICARLVFFRNSLDIISHFAVKKIAVGESHSYLINILKEVRLLERLHQSKYCDLSSCQFSSFGPKCLMQWAEGGSDASVPQSGNNQPSSPGPDQLSRSARIRAFREFQRASPEQRERMRTTSLGIKAVENLQLHGLRPLFHDIVEGLPGNVLLTWDEGKPDVHRLLLHLLYLTFPQSTGDVVRFWNLPRHASLFALAIRKYRNVRLEYTSPESLPSPLTGLLNPFASDGDAVGSKVGEGDKMDRLENEVATYPGFKSNQALAIQFDSRRLPRAFLVLLEGLLHVTPSGRAVLDPVPLGNVRIHDDHSLIPAPRRLSNPDIEPDEPVETNIERRSDGHVADTEVPDGHNWEEETQTLLLSLPAPIENVSPWAMVAAQIIPLPAPSILVNRTVKSGILVAKVRTF